MDLSLCAAFWLVSVLFVITPGADWAYVISAGINGRAVPAAVSGLVSGHLLATLIVAAGVGTLVSQAPFALTLLTTAGVLYLAWLGLQMLRHPSAPMAATATGNLSTGRWALKGLCVSGLNPKVLLLFLALLPQFTSANARWPLALQMVTLGLLHVANCTVVYLLVGYGSRTLLQTRPQAAKNVGRVSGALMIIIAALIMTERLI